jgi:transcriptional regulator GlxA family with amidase domain
MNQVDAQFLRRLSDAAERNLSDFKFDMDALAQEMAVSRRSLFRKLKAVTGCTPKSFVRNMRLKRAAQLLQTSNMTVLETTYAVGFLDLKHFRALFRDYFGMLPREYAKVAWNADTPALPELDFSSSAPRPLAPGCAPDLPFSHA